MRFDVVITTRDRPDMLVEALESALAQTAGGVRVSVVDNASGQATADVLARFAGRVGVERIDHAVPFQECLTRAQERLEAPYGMVLHDDDLLDATYVETALEAFERHPDAGLVAQHVRPLAEPGFDVPELASPFGWARVFGHAPTGTGPAGAEILLPPGAFPALVARLPWASPYWPAVSLRTEAFRAAGPFDGDLGMLVDVDMWLRVGARHPVLLLDAVGCSYRFHPGSMTTRLEASHGDGFIRDVLRMHEEERAGTAVWRWSDEESRAWLSYALVRSHGAGRAAQRADYDRHRLGRTGADLDELRRHHLRARLLRERALGARSALLRPLAELWARARLGLDRS